MPRSICRKNKFNVRKLAGLEKVWKSGRTFLGNHTRLQEINQLQVK